MSDVVLDASAILAVAFKEKGGKAVMKQRSNAIVSAVNHTEVVSKLVRFGMPMGEIEIFLAEAFPAVIAFDHQQADLAGRLHAENKVHRLSYADCACVALAMTQGIPVLTRDRKWLEIPLNVEVRMFR